LHGAGTANHREEVILLKKIDEKKMKAIKKRWTDLQSLIKIYSEREGADAVLLERLEGMAEELEKEGFRAIPED